MRAKALIISFAVIAILAGAFLVAGKSALADDEKKKSERAYLGVYARDLSKARAEKLNLEEQKGAYISNVVTDSPADKAGLKDDDLVIRFAGKAVESADDLTDAIHEKAAGDVVDIVVLRDGKEVTLNATLGSTEDYRMTFYRGWTHPAPKVMISPPHVKVPKGVFMIGSKAWLGIQYQEMEKDLAQYFTEKDKGLLITNVEDDSPAAKGGLKAGDVIVSVGGRMVEDSRDLIYALDKADEDKPVDIVVIRHKKEMTISVTLEKNKDHFFKTGLFMPDGHMEDLDIRIPEIDLGDLDIHLDSVIALDNLEFEGFEDFIENIEDWIESVHVRYEDNDDYTFHMSGPMFDFSYKKDTITFNGKTFDTIKKFKEYIKSDEFKSEIENIKKNLKEHSKEMKEKAAKIRMKIAA